MLLRPWLCIVAVLLAGCNVERIEQDVIEESDGATASEQRDNAEDAAVCVLVEQLLVADLPVSEATAPNAYDANSFTDWCASNIRNDDLEVFVGNADAWTANATDPLVTATSPTGRALRPMLAQGARLELHVLDPVGTIPFVRKIHFADWQGPDGNCALEMRVYQQDPGATGKKPLLYLHGGGWRNRTTTLTAAEVLVSHLVETHVVFMPAYPLNGNKDGPAECRRAAFADILGSVQQAFDWVSDNMSVFGVTPGAKIDLMGHSAGGQLAMWLGTQNVAEAGKVVNFYGPVEFADFIDQARPGGRYAEGRDYAKRTLARLLDVDDVANLERPYGELVLQNSVSEIIAREGAGAIPPFLIVQGNADTTVPVEQALIPCRALGGEPAASGGNFRCGADSRVIIVDDAGHNFDRRCMNGLFPESMEEDIDNPLARYCPAANADNGTVRKAVLDAYAWLTDTG